MYYVIMNILRLIQGKEICSLGTHDYVLLKPNRCILDIQYHKKSECNVMNKKSCKPKLFHQNVVQLLNYEMISESRKYNSGPEYFPKLQLYPIAILL